MKRSSESLGVPDPGAGAGVVRSEAGGKEQTVNGLDRWAIARVAAGMGQPPVDLRLWDGSAPYTHPNPCGSIIFNDRKALWRVIAQPEMGLGDGFSVGRIEVDGDLMEILTRCYSAVEENSTTAFKRGFLGKLPEADLNTLTGSRKHIAHHYDLGNEFYRLWLDQQMVYTCAYYEDPSATLEQAQIAKMDHVARKLRLREGMQVIEAGCGWGSLALHMARHYGVKVRAFNISREQLAFARERAEQEQLTNQVEFVEDDYRNIQGECDAFVSVGMLEHVGLDNFKALGDVIQRTLAPHGLALVHSVGRNRPTPVNAWLEKRIFPGSYPPSLSEMMNIFEPANLSVLDVENLRMHYAATLTEWLRRFDSSLDTIRRTHDEYFIRAWRLYLAGCAAAFKSGSIQLFQVLVAPPRNNGLALTRQHIYSDEASAAWDISR